MKTDPTVQEQPIIHHAQFATGVIGTDDIFDIPRKHVAFVGRSNVGKSSVINYLLGRNSLVRSSSRPGKTTEINFFEVENSHFFVDLPGYGFARMGEKQREKLRKLILWYLMYTDSTERITFVVLDAQAGLTDFDRDIVNLLRGENQTVYVIANKMDKLNQKQQHALQSSLENELQVPVLFSSTLKKRGRKKIWNVIGAVQ